MRELRRKARTFLLCAAAVLGLARTAAADRVYFRDDEEPIEGKIVREDKSSIVIEIGGGRLTIDRARIARIERSAPAPAPAPAPGPAPAPPSSGPTPGPAVGAPPRGPTPGPAPAPLAPSARDPRVAPVLAAVRGELAAAARAGPAEVDRAASVGGSRLAALGPDAAPTLAAALVDEADPAAAAALERSLGPLGGSVPGDVLVAAVERRRLASGGPLLRAAGAHGGAAGAKALASLLDGAREGARRSVIEALGRSGEGEAVARLLGLLESTGEDAAVVEDAFRSALRRGVSADASDGGAGARKVALVALGRLDGPKLVVALKGVTGGRFDGLLDALGRIVGAGAGGRDPEARRAAVQALGAFVGDQDFPNDANAMALLTRFVKDGDEEVRLAAANHLGRSRELAAIPPLIDAFESDPSPAVQDRAHASLRKFTRGRSKGQPADWRAWLEAGAPGAAVRRQAAAGAGESG